MKKFILLAAVVCALAATAQSKLSPSTQLFFNKNNNTMQRIKGDNNGQYIPVILQSNDVEALDEYGIIVGSQTDSYVTALVPASLIPQIDEIDCIDYLFFNNPSRPMLDEALTDMGYYQIDEKPYTMPYTGKGVIVGVVDIGFQWDHMALRNADGSTRILAAWNQNDTTGEHPEDYEYGSLYDTQEELWAAPICTVESHGTHVTSIAAGTRHDGVPYHGVAPEASLILVEALHDEYGSIQDAAIVDGICFIFEMAEELGMPCVINLSLGNYFGPHDGTSPFDMMCDYIQGEGRLIVGSMGNSGAERYHLGYDFDTQPAEFRAGLKQQGSSLPYVDIWSDAPIQVGLELYHGKTDTLLDWTGWIPFGSPFETTVKFFDQEVLVEAASSQYEANGKYNMQMRASGIRNLGNCYFALRVMGESGKVNMWCQSPATQFHKQGFEEWLDGDTIMTMNETGGTGKRITSVGSYTTDIEKNTNSGYSVDYTLHAVSPFSGRGPSADGRMKPEVAAPGCIITAAFNKRISSVPGKYYNNMLVDSFALGDQFYHYGASSGTSMAAPIVTGTYAMWLQANPTLTPEQAKEILSITSSQDEYTTNERDMGYGKIRPYEGLCHILEASSLNTPDSQTNILVYPTAGDGAFTLYCGDNNEPADINIYNTTGALVAHYETAGCGLTTHTIPTAQVGIYYIQVTTANSSCTYKYILQ